MLPDEDDHTTVCYYGAPGTGKTTSAAHLAKLGRTLVFPVEPGLKKRPLERLGVPTDRLDPVDGSSYDAVMRVYHHLAEHLEKTAADDPKRITGVVIDSVTEMTARWTKGITNVENSYKKSVRNPWLVDRSYHGIFGAQARDVFERFIDLPVHVALTGHVRRDADEDTGSVKYGPATIPSVQKDIVALFDVIMHVTKDGAYDDGTQIMVGDARGDSRYEAKDRDGILPPVLVNPTMDRIIKYVTGDLTAETDVEQQKYNDHKEGK